MGILNTYPMPSNKHFDILAPHYDRLSAGLVDSRLFRLVDLPPGGRLLDAGGGTGRKSSPFTSIAAQIVVADVSMGMLKEAGGKPGIQAIKAPAEALPFPSDHFDRVLMVDALHHVYDQARAAQELWRVTRLGGRIVIEEPDIRRRAVKLIAFFERIALMRSRFLSPGEIEALFTNNQAVIRTEVEGPNAWIIVDKPG
jgi:demethylmenaquinone methyltransferase/2-methoxy-6-polyprenyl-1,4-benzoquinol methylase